MRAGSGRTLLHDLTEAHPDCVEIETLDITRCEQISALRERLHDRTFDMLFVNAGTTNPDPTQHIGEVSTQDFVDLMITNALGPMRVVERLCDRVRAAGLIGVMSSGQGSISDNESGQRELYRGSKAALNQFMRSFAARQVHTPRPMALIAPGEAFLQWGWRVPFLLSFVLIVIGSYVRRRVEESPVFTELAERKEETRMPIVQLFRRHALLVIVAALVFAGNNAVGYMTTGGYIQRYATDPKGPIGLATADVLGAVTLSAITWLLFTFLSGWISDRIGRRTTYLIGWVLQLIGVFLLFPLVDTGSIVTLTVGLVILTVGLGFTYGPQAALYAELFPASIRFSGVSISYAIGAILGGAFAPTIAQAIVQATGSTTGVTWYLAGMTVLGLVATLLLRDRSGIPLGPDHEAEQAVSPLYGMSKA